MHRSRVSSTSDQLSSEEVQIVGPRSKPRWRFKPRRNPDPESYNLIYISIIYKYLLDKPRVFYRQTSGRLCFIEILIGRDKHGAAQADAEHLRVQRQRGGHSQLPPGMRNWCRMRNWGCGIGMRNWYHMRKCCQIFFH